jgi:phosphoglycolate phosphatase
MQRFAVFDQDGTLVNSVPDLLGALNRVVAKRGMAAFTEDEVRPMIGDGAGVLLKRAFATRGRVPDREVMAELVADYTAHAAELSRPYPGVVETLTLLREQGWVLSVCSNKPASAARAELAGLGLAGLFAFVAGGDSFAVRKPDPGHVLQTLAASGGDPARAVMVGDHHNDIDAASAAGVASVWARWGYGTDAAGASAEASSFSQLPALLDQLLPV